MIPDLKHHLAHPETPWQLSDALFARLASDSRGNKQGQVLPIDREWSLVREAFFHEKPTHFGIGKIHAVVQRSLTTVFKAQITNAEKIAGKFSPTWRDEPRLPQREQTMETWQAATDQFSPFAFEEDDGRKVTFKQTKILPLWHGTRKEIAESIADSGFAFFGKTTIDPAQLGPTSTDDGFFGSGIYFTNSPRYAAEQYAKGTQGGVICLAWVSMREPFPFAGDDDQSEMAEQRGIGAYKSYDAHIIPVVRQPNSLYYPTKPGENPTYYELVVFNSTQTLPCFIVELMVDSPLTSLPRIQGAAELMNALMLLMNQPEVRADTTGLQEALAQKFTLLSVRSTAELTEKDKDLFEKLPRILDSQRRIDNAVLTTLQPYIPQIREEFSLAEQHLLQTLTGNINEALLKHYAAMQAQTLVSLSSNTLAPQTGYIRLALIQENEQKEKEKEVKETQVEDGRPSTYETLFHPKDPISLETIFDQKTLQNKDRTTLLVLGAAGVGKTTTAYYIATQVTQGTLWQTRFSRAFLICFRSLTSTRYPTDHYTPEEIIAQECNLPIYDVQTLLKNPENRKRTLLILDGYDEIPVDLETNTSVKRAFEELKALFPHTLITSRPQTIPFSSNMRLEILGFDQAGIDHYIDQAFDEDKVEQVKAQLNKHPLVKSLAHIPINLQIICSLFQSQPALLDQDFPSTVTGFYDMITKDLMRRYLLRPECGLRPSEVLNLANPRLHPHVKNIILTLEDIAQEATQSNKLYVSSEEVEEISAERGVSSKQLLDLGLFRPQMGCFIHLTFQEFFTATRLANLYLENDPAKRGEAKQFVAENKFKPRYALIFWMTAGLLGKRSKLDPLQAFFDDLFDEPYDLAEAYHFQIITRCFTELRDPKQIIQYAPFMKDLAVYVKEEITQERLNKRIFIDNPKLLSCEEIRPIMLSFLDAKNVYAISLLGDFAENGERIEGEIFKKLVALKVYHSGLYLNLALDRALNEILRGEEKLKEEVIKDLVALLKDPDSDTRGRVAWALSEIVEKGEKLEEEVIKDLVALLKDPDPWVRNSAVRALEEVVKRGEKLEEEVIKDLVALLKDPHSCVRGRAADALGEVVKRGEKLEKEIIEGLFAQLKDPDPVVSANVGNVLGRIVEGKQKLREKVIKESVALLKNPREVSDKDLKKDLDEYSESGAVFTLGKIVKGGERLGEEVIHELVTLIKDPDPAVVWKGICALEQIVLQGQELEDKKIRELATFLKDSDNDVRSHTALALGKILESGQKLGEEVIKELVNLLKDPDREVLWSVVFALEEGVKRGEKLGKGGIKDLIILMKAPEKDLRKSAADALREIVKGGEKLEKEVIGELVVLLKDSHKDIQGNAAMVLGRIAREGGKLGEDVIGELVVLIKDPDGFVRDNACAALEAIVGAGEELEKEVIEKLNSYLQLPRPSSSSRSLLRIFESSPITVLRKRVKYGEVKIGEEVIRNLFVCLRDPDEHVRSQACSALEAVVEREEKLEEEFIIELVSSLEQPGSDSKFLDVWTNNSVRALVRVARGGKKLEEKVIRVLVALLKAPRENVTKKATVILLEIKPHQILYSNSSPQHVQDLIQYCRVTNRAFVWSKDKMQIVDASGSYDVPGHFSREELTAAAE